MAAPKISVYVQPGTDTRTTLNTGYSALTEANVMKYNVSNPYQFGTMEHVEDAATRVELSRVVKLWIYNNGTANIVSQADVTKRVSRLRDCELYALSYEIFPDGLRYGTTDKNNTENYLKDINPYDEEKRIITRSTSTASNHTHREEAILDEHWIKAKLGHITNSGSFTFTHDTDYIPLGTNRHQAQTVSKWLSICSEYGLYVRNLSDTTGSDSANARFDILSNSMLYGEGSSAIRCAKVTIAIIPPYQNTIRSGSTTATPGTYQFLLCLKGYYT